MRRTLIIVLIALVLIGIGVFVYFYFFANKAGVTVSPGNLPVAGQGTGTGAGGLATTTNRATLVTARLVKISAGPVVPGAVVTYVLPATTTAQDISGAVVSYIERQSGNVFTYNEHTGTLTRTNNKTIPGIQSAVWLPDASFAFVRYLSGADFSTINTYALPSSGSGGFFLQQNITDLSISSSSILTLASGVNGSVASLGHANGTQLLEVFTTPLSALHTSFAGNMSYLAYTKPSATLEGNAFIVTKGHFSRVAGPLNGLAALSSPSGKWVLVSYTQDTAMQMELVNTATGDEIQLPVSTIADKCVWAADDSALYCGIPVSPPNNYAYPDDWYQGAVHFSDRIWKIDVVDRQAQLVLDFPKETKDSLDAIALAIDPLATTLVFVNKNDGSLWSYQL
ncbi:hypothetical protein A2609_03520 [Candidatus Kaiserbacteria bacterium RIFOXYD1_FULL_47_14]|uniref:Uncharacterized protein n=1 Tax=Candidatus Kaiserbacteria bacterium RIFOXYD1_FULL_47_14 TaxID=1798533 RepID=A0A1F6G459_9BACT|nr:MAG: hypothetical protein A2609_03520 [Candidatus Kaiserbacteria bacterium RIFOXYD1_FULL_47_14]